MENLGRFLWKWCGGFSNHQHSAYLPCGPVWNTDTCLGVNCQQWVCNQPETQIYWNGCLSCMIKLSDSYTSFDSWNTVHDMSMIWMIWRAWYERHIVDTQLSVTIAIRHQNHRNGFPWTISSRFTALFDYLPPSIIANIGLLRME